MFKITFTTNEAVSADFFRTLLAGHPTVQSIETEVVRNKTPFNNQMIGIVADRFNLSVCYVSQWLSDNNVSCVEEAIQKTTINGMADFLREAFSGSIS